MLKSKRLTIFLLIEILFLLPIIFLCYSNFRISNAYDSFETELDVYKEQGWDLAETEKDYYDLKSTSFFDDIRNFQETPKSIKEARKALLTSQKELEEELKNKLSEKYDNLSEFEMPELESEIARIENELLAIETYVSDKNYSAAQIGLENVENEIKSLNIKETEYAEDKYVEIDSRVKAIKELCKIYRCKISEYKGTQETDSVERYKDYLAYYEGTKGEFNSYAEQKGSWESNKRIIVSISGQYLYMVEDYKIIDSFPTATGISGHGTSTGEFEVLEKLGTVWGYYRIWMPYWMTIYYSGGLKNGIHGIPWYPTGQRWTFWEDRVGLEPLTYGCVMPHDSNAKKLYEWAEVGIPVSILW